MYLFHLSKVDLFMYSGEMWRLVFKLKPPQNTSVFNQVYKRKNLVSEIMKIQITPLTVFIEMCIDFEF